MRRKLSALLTAALGALLAVFLLVDLATCGSWQVALGQATEVGEVLRRGRQLEVERRWGEALSYYEDAVREFPDDGSLQRRFQFTRLHYDLARRYSDPSYRDAMARLSLDEAMSLYSEVLLKIQVHYVEVTNWKELVEQGTNSFEVALSEPMFFECYALGADAEAVDRLRHELRRTVGARVIQSRGDARDAVAAAAGLAARRLGIRSAAVVQEYTCGATSALDAYSAYLTPRQRTDVYSQIEGNFVGLGVELRAEDGALSIVRVIPHSPAQQSGLRAGDRIVGVDGVLTRDLSGDQAADRLQGEPGSVVELSVLTPGQEPRPVSVRRRRVDVPSVEKVEILDADLGVAYFKLACFQKTTASELDAALWQLYRAGMKALIIDLRGNPGGLLPTAVQVADHFVSRGTIVSTQGRNPQEDFTYPAHESGTWRVPLVVIIDHQSASAAEIFAGAIRDHRRGTVVGTRSYGKGSVQSIFPLSTSGAGVRLTTAKFYSPSGRAYSHLGVAPDVVVPKDAVVHQVARPVDGSAAAPPKANQDAALAAALEAARGLLKRR
jgi:carboxyl-terminal processing protease